MKKKIVVIVVAAVLAAALSLSLIACNSGGSYVPAQDMMSIFTELRAGTADVGVMDSVMAGYYLKNNTTYAETMTILDFDIESEEYGIGFRKGSEACGKVNQALAELDDAAVAQIAATYGLTDSLLDVNNPATKTYDADGQADWTYIQGKGTLVIGITIFAPIAYYTDDSTDADKLAGFDIDLAKAVCAKLGITAEFKVINWKNKEAELESKTIDCIWNGMTINEERLAGMEISTAYLKNQQIAVCLTKNADKYNTVDDLKKAVLVAEAGSAGEAFCNKLLGIE